MKIFNANNAQKRRIRTENIDIIYDNDIDEEIISRIMDLAASASHEAQETQAEATEEVSEITLRRRH